MQNSNEISEIMLGHHALINLLLLTFKEALGKNDESADRLFDEFRWELDKHIFVEERVVFKFCESKESEICGIIKGLVKEHDTMLVMLNEVKNNLMTKSRADTQRFEELLIAHRRVEEEKLYPLIDKTLSRTEKEAIIARINEVPVKE